MKMKHHCFVLMFALSGVLRAQQAPAEYAISGRLIDGYGRPLPGLLVRAVPLLRDPVSSARANVGEPDDRPIAELAAEYARRLERERAGTRETRSDDTGRFRFSDLEPVRYRVTPYGENLRFPSIWLKPGESRDFTGRPVVPIRFDVRFADGRVPGSGVGIEWLHPGRDYSEWSPEGKRAWLPNGKGKLRALYGADREWASGYIELDTDTHANTETVRLVLKGRPGLNAQLVVPEASAQNTGGRIVIVPLADGQGAPSQKDFEPPANASERQRREAKRTKRVGPTNRHTAVWHDLEPGRYFIGYTFKTNPTKLDDFMATDVVTVGDGRAAVRLQFDTNKLGPHIDLAISGPDGALATDPRVFVVGHTNKGGQHTVTTRITRQDERTWRVWVVDPDPFWSGASSAMRRFREKSVPKHFKITVSHPEYGSRKVKWIGEKDEAVEIRFEEPGRLEAAIEDYAGHELAGHCGVVLREDTGAEVVYNYYIPSPAIRVETNGRTPLRPAQPGKYRLELFVEGEDGRFGMQKSIPVELRAGPQTVALSLPELFDVEVEVKDAPRGQMYYLVEKGRDWMKRSVGAVKGKVVFKRVRPGSYVLTGPGLDMPVHVDRDLQIVAPGQR